MEPVRDTYSFDVGSMWVDAVIAIRCDHVFLLAGILSTLESINQCYVTEHAPHCCFVPYRCSTNSFYRQLYRGLKEIDTLQVADEVTASIMY